MLRFLLAAFLVWVLPPAPLLAGYEWRSFADDDDQIALWQEGRQIGNYRISTHEYFPHLASGIWGERCASPYPPPLFAGDPATVERDGTLNFGIDLARMPAAGKHLLNDKEASKEELLQAIGEPRLPDDSKWMCLTVIGSEADRKRVLDDLQSSPALSSWKNRIKVQDYPPEHWAVAQAGFVTAGHPTIYCQAAGGKVLHRQDEYRGPEALAEVLRKADPAYQPDKDPDLNKPLSNIPPWVWIGGGVLVFLLLKGDDK